MNIFRNPPYAQVARLLSEASLPFADLAPEKLGAYFGCGPPDAPEAVVGLELYGHVCLLRSLAVDAAQRSRGRGRALVAEAENYARSCGVTEIYLITETAELYFEGLGFERTARENAPEAIQQTREFAGLCPAIAVLMVKRCGPESSGWKLGS